MKKILGIAFGVFALSLALSANSFAQGGSKPRGINNRQENQRDRIQQGIKSGELNKREAARLIREEKEIGRQEARFRQSGDGLSPRERAILEHELNESSRRIYNQKHDGQERHP
ncbi:MAG: hypothetical protein ACKVQJ_02445 [Pyrinomonadaceae bacterium]